MNILRIAPFAAAALIAMGAALPARAAIVISEVAPWSSGNSPVAADWFELTNTGSSAVNIGGWKVDDNSNSFSAAVALNGIASIGAGESVIFIEGATTNSTFRSNWFGTNVPAGLQLGSYSGSGIGLSASGDALNIFTAAGTLVTRVDFGASPTGPSFATFDNSAGASNVTLSVLSSVGVNGAFAAINSPGEIGSPGRVSAVPEPSHAALLLGGLAVMTLLSRKRRG